MDFVSLFPSFLPSFLSLPIFFLLAFLLDLPCTRKKSAKRYKGQDESSGEREREFIYDN